MQARITGGIINIHLTVIIRNSTIGKYHVGNIADALPATRRDQKSGRFGNHFPGLHNGLVGGGAGIYPSVSSLPGRVSTILSRAIPHNSKCRYGERGAADAKPKAQIILDAAKVSAASGGNSEPKQGQRSQSARGFCPRSTMRVPQPDIIEHFGNADAVPQLPERCLSRKAGIVRYCPRIKWYTSAAAAA